MTDLVVVVSDLQAPLHSERDVAALATFIADRNLQTVCVGDSLDAWQVSRWCKGLAGEFDGGLDEGRQVTMKLLSDLRVRHMSRSNHDERVETYVKKYAPALGSIPELRLEQFLGLDRMGITFHRRPFECAPKWLLMHGDEGSLIQSAGGTGLGLAARTGMSVVCGHTHRLGLQHRHQIFNGELLRPLWGFEVGHLMDMKKAEYLGAGHANWQSGFGILVVDGDEVQPIPVPISDGRFFFDGKWWQG